MGVDRQCCRGDVGTVHSVDRGWHGLGPDLCASLARPAAAEGLRFAPLGNALVASIHPSPLSSNIPGCRACRRDRCELGRIHKAIAVVVVADESTTSVAVCVGVMSTPPSARSYARVRIPATVAVHVDAGLVVRGLDGGGAEVAPLDDRPKLSSAPPKVSSPAVPERRAPPSDFGADPKASEPGAEPSVCYRRRRAQVSLPAAATPNAAGDRTEQADHGDLVATHLDLTIGALRR